MCWKFFSVKKILDALFDDSWCSLCLPETQASHGPLDLLLLDAQ